MLKRHREIFYGLLFGFGAALIDTFIDSKAQNQPFWAVFIGMIFYRFFFVLFGLVLGWLLWRKNQTERQFRSLQDEVQELRHSIGAPTTVIHAQAQLLLGSDGLKVSPEVQSVIRIIYEQSQKLQSINR